MNQEIEKVCQLIKSCKRIVCITGAGISADSGVPTFRGAGGFWGSHRAQDLATPEAFRANPRLVWQFYNYRRELVHKALPNEAHLALARAGVQLAAVITQNVDGLHQRASGGGISTLRILELHGNLHKARCTKCGLSCSGPLRPHIVWFGECLDPSILGAAEELLATCDLCLVIGTSSVVYPAAGLASIPARRGVPVVEVNLDKTDRTGNFTIHLRGRAADILPKLFPFGD